MANVTVISQLVNQDVPTIDITIKTNGQATPGDKTGSAVVVINDSMKQSSNITLKNSNLLALVDLNNPPKWRLDASLFNTSNVETGDHVYISVFLSFNETSSERIAAGEINEGSWHFPIIVTASGRDYLLAQVHVEISIADTTAAATAAKTSASPPAKV